MLSAPRLNSPIVQSSPREPQAEFCAKRRPFHCRLGRGNESIDELENRGRRVALRELRRGEGRRERVVIGWNGATMTQKDNEIGGNGIVEGFTGQGGREGGGATVALIGEGNRTYGGGNGRAVRATSSERVQGAAPLRSPRSYDSTSVGNEDQAIENTGTTHRYRKSH